MSKLSVDNVGYRYKNSSRMALDDVSCRFESGQLTAITGPSGSGKSTLLSILAGLDTPTAGVIYLDEASLQQKDLDQYRREDIAMIFQAFQLFPLLTVLENVCYPMELNGMKPRGAKVRAAALLESVGIGQEKHKRYPSHLSGGEQQRVAIARSLASGAKVLLADEPTGNLDVENSNRVMDILLNLAHQQGYCVIVVTHDMEIAEKADAVYRLRDGKLMTD